MDGGGGGDGDVLARGDCGDGLIAREDGGGLPAEGDHGRRSRRRWPWIQESAALVADAGASGGGHDVGGGGWGVEKQQ